VVCALTKRLDAADFWEECLTCLCALLWCGATGGAGAAGGGGAVGGGTTSLQPRLTGSAASAAAHLAAASAATAESNAAVGVIALVEGEPRAAALASVLGAAAGLAAQPGAEHLLHPALQLAAALLRRSPPLLCGSDAALAALWDIAIAPYAAASSPDPEAQAAGLELLELLLKLANPTPSGPRRVDPGLEPAAAAASAAAAARNAAAEARVQPRVSASLEPRVPALLAGLLSAITHTGAVSAIEPAASLLHAVATALPDAWRAAIAAAIAALSNELAEAGRELPPRAAELLLRACMVQPVPARLAVQAMWVDAAQVVRVGLSARALERHARYNRLE